MKNFTYTIKDGSGIHARPAGLIVNEAKKYSSNITIISGDKTASATRLMAIMSMGVKCGQTITVEVEGEDEAEAVEGMKSFLEANL